MAWQDDPAFKTNGVSNISKSDCDNEIVENLKYLARRDSVRASSVGTTSVSSGTATRVDFASGSADWDVGLGTYFSSSTDSLDFQSGNEGVWYHGATGYFEANSTGDRRISVERKAAGSATDTSRRRTITSAERKTRLSMASVDKFDVAGDGIEVEALQTSGSALDVSADFWGMWIGVTDNGSSTGALSHTVLDEDTNPTDWWNNWRSNAFRLYRRPACRLRKTSAQSISDATFTAATFGTSQYDTAGMGSTDDIEIQYDGYYYVSTCLGLDNYNGTNDRFLVQFTVNGSGFGTISTSHEVGAGDSYCTHEDIINLDAGDLVGVRVFKATTGGTTALVVDTQCHLSATLVSGDLASSLAPGRQFFYDGLPHLTDDIPTLPFQDIDGDFLPRGLANFFTRDVWAHLWNPPVMGVQASTGGNTLSSGGWTQIDLEVTRYDNWGVIGTNKSGGGLTLPMDGVYLVVGSAQLDGNDDSGTDGDRGLRIKHGSDNVAPVRRDSATVASHYWGQAVSSLINGTAGDVVSLEGLSSAADEVDVSSALLHVVWMAQKDEG